MTDQPYDPYVDPDVEVIDPADLPDDDQDAFHSCEEGENLPDDIVLGGGARAFGNTSRHVLATWLPAAFKKWGVKFVLVNGWEDRGRPMSAGYFDPNAILNHHTGSTSSASNPAPSLKTLIEGRSDLRGPLCQVSTAFNGITYIIAAGRANHAGKARAAMGNPAGDGNEMYVGNEVQTNGTQKMPQVQYDAVVRVNAAILDHWGYKTATKAGLHATTSLSGKWDLGAGTGVPGVPYDIDKLRRDVDALLKAGPPKPPPVPPTTTTREPSMVLVRVKNTDPVFVSNGIERRWVQNRDHLDALVTAIRAEGGKGAVTVIEALDLDGFGALAGPVPK